MKYLLVFLLGAITPSCTDESKPISERDLDVDQGVDLMTDLSDVSGVFDMSEDLPPKEITCRRDSDCPRGNTCHDGVCASAQGCVFLTDFRPEVGCYFDHGLDFDEGLFSPSECEMESDCTDPEEPNCIARICSRLTPCTQDIDCPDEMTCRHYFYCK